MADLMYSKQTV